jgi:hypothetical protein
MNSRFWFGVMCTLVLAPLVSCQPVPEPQSILKKAIAAHGGENNISKPRIGVLRASSKTAGNREHSSEDTFDLPKRWKRVTTKTVLGKKTSYYTLMAEGKLWEWDDGAPVRPVENQAGSQPHFGVLMVLLQLKSGKVKLSPLKKIDVEDRAAIGFRAAWDGQTADYYFNEETGMLAQWTNIWEPQPGKVFDAKTVFGDYKEIDGIKLPYRRTCYVKGGEFTDYEFLLEVNVSEVKILDKVPEEAFVLPK